AEHDFWMSRTRRGFSDVSDAMRQRMPPARHPIVRRAADGRPALYIGGHASHIVGMPVEEGRALLAELLRHATEPHYVYSHPWRPGDLVIWDNRCTLHRAAPFDDLRYRRDLRRTTVNEHGPER